MQERSLLALQFATAKAKRTMYLPPWPPNSSPWRALVNFRYLLFLILTLHSMSWNNFRGHPSQTTKFVWLLLMGLWWWSKLWWTFGRWSTRPLLTRCRSSCRSTTMSSTPESWSVGQRRQRMRQRKSGLLSAFAREQAQAWKSWRPTTLTGHWHLTSKTFQCCLNISVFISGLLQLESGHPWTLDPSSSTWATKMLPCGLAALRPLLWRPTLSSGGLGLEISPKEVKVPTWCPTPRLKVAGCSMGCNLAMSSWFWRNSGKHQNISKARASSTRPTYVILSHNVSYLVKRFYSRNQFETSESMSRGFCILVVKLKSSFCCVSLPVRSSAWMTSSRAWRTVVKWISRLRSTSWRKMGQGTSKSNLLAVFASSSIRWSPRRKRLRWVPEILGFSQLLFHTSWWSGHWCFWILSSLLLFWSCSYRLVLGILNYC